MKSRGRSEGTLGGTGRGCLLRLGALAGKLLSKGRCPAAPPRTCASASSVKTRGSGPLSLLRECKKTSRGHRQPKSVTPRVQAGNLLRAQWPPSLCSGRRPAEEQQGGSGRPPTPRSPPRTPKPAHCRTSGALGLTEAGAVTWSEQNPGASRRAEKCLLCKLTLTLASRPCSLAHGTESFFFSFFF